MERTMRVAWGSVGVSLAVLALKAAAYWVTGSVALYSDALETVINVAGAATALFALWYSARPADANHPYGHHKAEYFSAMVEGTLVLTTALLIGREAWMAWEHPHVPDAPLLGIGLNALAGCGNLAWGVVLLRQGRRAKSPALTAGGRHVLTDVWTTGGVIAGFALVPLTGVLRIDPAVAVLVALNILWSGYRMLREAVGGLMDEVTDPQEAAAIRGLIARYADGAIEAHDVRTRVAGRATFIEFHLVVPSRMAVEDAHEICDRIEHGIRAELGEAVINIHVEPVSKAKQHGIPVLM